MPAARSVDPGDRFGHLVPVVSPGRFEVIDLHRDRSPLADRQGFLDRLSKAITLRA